MKGRVLRIRGSRAGDVPRAGSCARLKRCNSAGSCRSSPCTSAVFDAQLSSLQHATYDESSFYADLISWIKMGEDVFPTVSDEKGVMTGGQLYEGNADDFVEIE